jgi:hypothetical protein
VDRTDYRAVLAVSRLIVRLAASFGALFAPTALIATIAIAVAAAQGTADSLTYPNRAVRIIVPFPAGGPTDILTRVIAQRLSEVWGQPVVIENQPGRQYRDRRRARRQNAGRRLHPVCGDGCHHGAQSRHLDQPVL